MKTNSVQFCPLHFCLPSFEARSYNYYNFEYGFYCPKCNEICSSPEDQIKEYGDLSTLPKKLKSKYEDDYVNLLGKLAYGYWSQYSMSIALGNWNNAINRLKMSYFKKSIKGQWMSNQLTEAIEKFVQKQEELKNIQNDFCFNVDYLNDKEDLINQENSYYSNRILLKELRKSCQIVAKNFYDVKKELKKIHKNCFILRMDVDEDAELDY